MNALDVLNGLAEREGWAIFETVSAGHAPYELQRCDDAARFTTDEDAWEHVYANADRGSVLHRIALGWLAYYSPIEHQAIVSWCQERITA